MLGFFTSKQGLLVSFVVLEMLAFFLIHTEKCNP